MFIARNFLLLVTLFSSYSLIAMKEKENERRVARAALVESTSSLGAAHAIALIPKSASVGSEMSDLGSSAVRKNLRLRLPKPLTPPINVARSCLLYNPEFLARTSISAAAAVLLIMTKISALMAELQTAQNDLARIVSNTSGKTVGSLLADISNCLASETIPTPAAELVSKPRGAKLVDASKYA